MSKTTNKFSPGVRERAVRFILDNEGQLGSRWQPVMSIAAQIGCTPQTLNEWIKKAEVDSGRRAGISLERWLVGIVGLSPLDADGACNV